MKFYLFFTILADMLNGGRVRDATSSPVSASFYKDLKHLAFAVLQPAGVPARI